MKPRSFIFVLMAAFLLGGCSSPEMKGTPFYSGKYQLEIPEADVNRVNLWPLAYYREPALSVLWPIFEKTEEHVAFRPLLSAYGDTADYWEYNVLWPLGQVDALERSNRLVPYFWGKTSRPGDNDQDYHILFPLWWHFEDEINTLIPLWYLRNRNWQDGRFAERSRWFGGPLAHFYTSPDESNWHVGPFCHFEDRAAETRLNAYPFPLCFSWRDKAESGFFTPLYARAETREAAREGWSASPLLLYLHTWRGDDDDRWLAGPLIRCATSSERNGWHALFFGRYADSDGDSSCAWYPFPLLISWRNHLRHGCFTPLYAFGTGNASDEPEGWSVSPLLLSWHTWADGYDDYWFAGPLGHYRTSRNGEAWHAGPFGHLSNKEANTAYSGYPWPLIFTWRNREQHGFFTPLYASWEDADPGDANGWAFSPLILSSHVWSKEEDDYWLAGFLGHYSTGNGGLSWHAGPFGHLHDHRDNARYSGYPWPVLFSWETPTRRGFFSPLYAYQEDTRTGAITGNSVLPPLLYWHAWTSTEDDHWLLGPLAHYCSGEEREGWRIGPAGRYRNPKSDATYTGYPWPLAFSWLSPDERGFFSPLYARLEHTGTDNPTGCSIIPPLLAWRSWTSTEDDRWLLGPLARFCSGNELEGWHVGPFGRYRRPKSDATCTGYPWPLAFSWRSRTERGLFSPLYCRVQDLAQNGDGWAALPLLLSWRNWGKDQDDLYGLLGLFARFRDGDARAGHLLPFYAYNLSENSFFSPLVGWKGTGATDESGYWYPLTPLVGVRTGRAQGSWLFPFYSHRDSPESPDYETSFLLLGYATHKEDKRATGERISTHWGFIPLYCHAYSTFTNSLSVPGSRLESWTHDDYAFVVCYSYRESTARFAPRDAEPKAGTNEMERARLRCWHESKKRGDVVSFKARSGIVPFWLNWTKSDTRPDGTVLSAASDSRLLLFLYDSKRETTPDKDYERRRILWHLWHYERRDGDTSIDLFPFITHDTHKDGLRKTSFLWRFYRHQVDPDGKTYLDLCFLPLVRTRPDEN